MPGPEITATRRAAPKLTSALTTALCVVRVYETSLKRGHHVVVEREAIPYDPRLGRLCREHSFFLAWVGDGGEVRWRKPLVQMCNDGYGARGVGEDSVVIANERLTHAQRGGSNWYWSTSKTLDVSPRGVRVLRESSGSGFVMADDVYTHSEWDATTLAGVTRWASPTCGEGEEGDAKEYVFQPIPMATLPDLYRSGQWRTYSNRWCATEVDAAGAKHKGFVISGTKGDPKDARMSVVMANAKEIYVEVEDDRWVARTKSRTYADHLELWWHSEATRAPARCLDAPSVEPVRWLVHLDGRVRRVSGAKMPSPKVEVVRPGRSKDGMARFKIRLPKEPGSLTVVYSDSDDGSSSERRIATSRLDAKDARTLGAVKSTGQRCDYHEKLRGLEAWPRNHEASWAE